VTKNNNIILDNIDENSVLEKRSSLYDIQNKEYIKNIDFLVADMVTCDGVVRLKK
jgi:hypothetical protein